MSAPAISHLPDDLTPLLLPLILPPTVPLPPHLLSPVFRHRLLYLPPLLTEMDRQLSPFPMPITSHALQTRLESLAGAYEVGPVKYAWDGESGLARRSVHKEGIEDDGDDECVEMHFLHDQEEGWGFHGLRLPGQADEMGLKWVKNPSELDMEASPSMDSNSSFDQGAEEGEGNGSLDRYAYTQGEDDAEVKDYWAGFSPPQSPTLEAEGISGAMIDEDEREREYWAQYSNGPSKASSPVVSRRPSEMVVSGSLPKAEVQGGGMERTEEEEGEKNEGPNRHRSGTIMASQLPSGATSPLPPSHPQPNPTLPSSSSNRQPSPNPNPNSDITLLRDRLRMKILSLLQREWTSFIGDGGQDEMEERGIRWLSIGREVNGDKTAIATGMSDEEGPRRTMGMLREMYEVFQPAGSGAEGDDGFYRLVEQALRSGEGAGGDGGNGVGGEAGIPRNYSFDQATYWE